jgi:outer membrane phospholipase A
MAQCGEHAARSPHDVRVMCAVRVYIDVLSGYGEAPYDYSAHS